MIEINLVPGAAKRQKQRAPKLGGGGGGGMQLPGFDRTLGMLIGAWVLGLGLVVFMHFGSSAKLAKLEVDVQAAQRDSARLQNLRVLNDSIRRQIDDISSRLTLLQEIDAGRYTWSHVLDEVARALPQYTWLVNISEASAGEAGTDPRVRIEGRTGNTFALARFMQDLEASAFLGNVRLLSQTQTTEQEKVVYAFILELSFQAPPPDAIETQPLFTETGDALVQADASTDSTREGN